VKQARSNTATIRIVILEAQNCFAGAPLLLSTTKEIFFRMTVYLETDFGFARIINISQSVPA
jgi:hypothetical protein